jgi:D-glycero-beta-D-manno-heptose 1-phosphate adenylyltransferase
MILTDLDTSINYNPMGRMDTIRSKILTDACLNQKLAYWRFKSHRIVFTNGCFDILHLGHVDYLARASDLGDVLVVGLNTDRSVRAIKGPPRPLQDEYSRSVLLASLSFVSAVILFDQDTPEDLIRLVRPDILVKGSDYRPEDIVGYEIVTSRGGSVETIDFVEGFSTSNILKKLSG